MRLRCWIAGLALAVVCGCGSDDDGEIADAIEFRLGQSVATVSRDPFRIEFGAAALTTDDGLFYERGDLRHGLTRVVAERRGPDSLEVDVETDEGSTALVWLSFDGEGVLSVQFLPPLSESVTQFGARLESPADEVVYGLTERLRDGEDLLAGVGLEIDREEAFPVEVGSLDRRGDVVRMRVRPTYALYAPFYQTSRRYGLFVDGTALGEFDVAAGDPEAIEFRFAAAGGGGAEILRFHIIDAPDPAAILDEYTRITGRPFVPPDWAFRHWRWRDELMTAEPALLDGVAMNAQLVEDVTMYEALGFPPGVYMFDRPVLAGNFGFARFAWDEQRLPNPDAMVDALRGRGYHLVMWSSMWACGSAAGDNGAEAQQRGYLAPSPNPRLPVNCANIGGANFILDPTHPEVPAWWGDKLGEFVADFDIQGIKLDRGEEHIPSSAQDVWADGRTGVEVRNAYPTLQAKIHHDAMQRRFGGDMLVITRSGYTGAQRWAITWGGDTPGREAFGSGPGTDLGLRSAIIKQLRAAFLGFPIWGSDTGGYYEFTDREVFARWLQFSAFSGIMEIGGTGAHAPWAMPSPPHFDEEMVDIYRRYTGLREVLLPYLVQIAGEAGASGMPMARPMVFAYPDDPVVADMWDQYMFGPDLLVAPVWRSGERRRSVYLPAGEWVDYWETARRFTGPVTIAAEAPLDTIPVYARAGAVIAAQSERAPARE